MTRQGTKLHSLRGKKPKKTAPLIILFNKPYGVLCQFTDSEGRKNLSHYISVKDVYPAGRLDTDSEGLLILTNDGALQHKITDPKNKMKKTYLVQVEGTPEKEALQKLRNGIELKDGPTLPATVEPVETNEPWPRSQPIRVRKSIPTSWLKITITEGRNRQVRRMTAAVGLPTLRLIRISIGPWNVDGLKPGDYKKTS